jgi:putative lipase involved disintegration of autophagic bodies
MVISIHCCISKRYVRLQQPPEVSDSWNITKMKQYNWEGDSISFQALWSTLDEIEVHTTIQHNVSKFVTSW